ncbi:hypothetical protein BELL_0215g00140 [Botrytis elliptica]|uniref:Phosphatidylethanolamine-binding protein n=1 Tax=Botrytis elliptica TaxID=278938 RepID=A0A4Z1JPL1_9HELO|nr:hypothetical protein EAE99_001115 [Botrytis elliptica]TGO75406.1 hypothetical protein BELL_0215g00140 [Botrytis elliptica]
MQLLASLTLLLTAFIELSSALVLSPESYDYDISGSYELRTEKLKSLKGIKKTLKKSSIIPDVLDLFIPACYVLPSYTPSSSSSSSKKVKLGNKLRPSQTQSAPSIQVFCPGKYHVKGGLTIILTDPDAPSRDDDSMSEMCHWIARIPEAVVGREGVSGEWSGSELEEVGLVDYKAPAPPKGTGKHRYVFVLLEGDNVDLKEPEERKHWGFEKPESGIREWAERENLTVVGANFLYEKYHREGKGNKFNTQGWFERA